MHAQPHRPQPIPHPAPCPRLSRRLAHGLALALIMVALWLRAHALARESLWLDEAFSAWMSEQALPDLLSWIVQIDQHPPLYYLVLWVWTRMGGSLPSPVAHAFWVRLPSACFGTLAVAALYRLGRHLAGRTTGLLAALLLALSPFHVWFGQEARMYALLALNASLAMLGLLRIFIPPVNYTGGTKGGWPAWTLYILSTAATLWTHNTALLFWAATNLSFLGWMLVSRKQETGFCHFAYAKNLVSLSFRKWLLAQFAILLLWSPWLAPFFRQAAGVDREFWLAAPTWATLGDTLSTFLSAFLPRHLAWQVLAWLAAGVLLIAGLYALRTRPRLLALLLTLLLAPIAGELLVSLRRPIYYTRTLIGASLPFYMLLAAGAARALPVRPAAGPRRRAIARVALFLALGTLVAANARSLHRYYTNDRKEAWDQAAAYVAQHAELNDLILFNASWVQLPFDFYFDPPIAVVERGLPVDLFDRGVLEPKMAEQDLPYLHALLQGHARAWLVYSHNWYTDPQGLIPAALAQHGHLVDHQRFQGIELYRYEILKP